MDRLESYVRILENLGTPIMSDTVLLDFGCGDGELVRGATVREIDAYGCDIDFSQVWIDEDLLAGLLAENRVRKIGTDDRDDPLLSPLPAQKYRLPFDDAMFDVVISDQVLEHVFNFAEVTEELYRVMKPGAVFLHMFPPRLSLIEAHTYLPFSAAFHPDWWLRAWARLGIRNEYQRGFSVEQTFEWNRLFLNTAVNYLKRSELELHFSRRFHIFFVERKFFRESKRARLFLHPSLYGAFRGRVMYGIRRNQS